MELWQLQQMQGLPLELKVRKTQLRIREWYEHYNGDVYVSFSGGKDSTVLLHIVREMYPDVPAVFSDTGLEFPEIRAFVKTIPNVTWLKPAMSFRQVLEKHGYPWLARSRRNGSSAPAKATRWSCVKSSTAFGRMGRTLNSVCPQLGAICLTHLSRSARNAATK